MPGIVFKGDDFAGIQDAKRRAIYEAESAAAAAGVLPDDKEKRKAIIDRLQRRLARQGRGWDFRADETVVRVDEQGVARIIPKDRAVGWMEGLPAHPGTRDVTSRYSRPGRKAPLRKQVFFNEPEIKPVDPRIAAQNFHARIVGEMERTGYIPAALRQELAAQGWRLGQPVPRAKIDEWCARFQAEWHNKYGER
jgi:hypothetical protein